MGWVTAAVAIIGAGMSAYQASEAAGTQADQYKAAAQAQADQTVLNQLALEKQRKQALGKQAALYSASGVTLDGTPSDIMSQTSGEYARTSYNMNFGNTVNMNSLNASADAAIQAGQAKATGTLLNTSLSLAQTGFPKTSAGPVTPTVSQTDEAGNMNY